MVAFTLTVSPVNDAPSFVPGGDVLRLEDAGPVTISGWASSLSAGPGETGQTLQFVLTANGNPALFSSAPSVDSAGTLRFTPAPNANGTAVLVLVLRDSGGTADGGEDTSAPAIFTVTVQPVNDAPSFVPGADVAVEADSRMYTAPWASGMSPGPADEAGQTLWFQIVSNDNPSLFAASPSLSPAGVLSFMPAPAAAGTARLGVRLLSPILPHKPGGLKGNTSRHGDAPGAAR